ncbi:hypothetical protein CK489_25510 [Bradyrhizobium sp. UFLA03-84]|uniref:hypothetical protein n=1 Tax=Bradyrhizobium sp. UFLA03-84 TaxID=418599 RepID=UPI000BADFB74|nr:hypothetical protein [Bradyrhizobium sp. UFLA03-84]PAY06264.1 hypothetical protein CK489_25510 [Bradyrhizobium sp. UFLA03-84]
MAASMLCLSSSAAIPIDCATAPSVKCLATEAFLLAKKLPAGDGNRAHVEFAEQELADTNLEVALDYVTSDNPDPSPWEAIEWIARAGRFGDALETARQRRSTVERLGGMIVVAALLVEKDAAQAREIVEDVERELPSIAGDSDEASQAIPALAAKVWAGLGQSDRTLRLVGGHGASTVDWLLVIANTYPAAGWREEAWREAERLNEPFPLQQLLSDALTRGDQAEISRAGQRAARAVDRMTSIDAQPSEVIALARALLAAGSPQPAARLVEPWPQWLDGKDDTARFNVVSELITVLAGLARDRDVETAAAAVSTPARRSQCLSKAADEYSRRGRRDLVEKRDAEAMMLAMSSPTGDTKPQWEHNEALINLALARAGRGDVDGAIAAATKVRDDAKVRETISYVVKRAIDTGHGAAAAPAIEALEQRAGTAQDAPLLLAAANARYMTGDEDRTRDDLAQVLTMARLTGNDAGLAAELAWRLDGSGTPASMITIVDKFGVTDPGAIDHLVEIIRPLSPAVAVQLAGRQVEVWRQIDELANIGVQLAADTK